MRTPGEPWLFEPLAAGLALGSLTGLAGVPVSPFDQLDGANKISTG